jgi:hypothetical protein
MVAVAVAEMLSLIWRWSGAGGRIRWQSFSLMLVLVLAQLFDRNFGSHFLRI